MVQLQPVVLLPSGVDVEDSSDGPSIRLRSYPSTLSQLLKLKGIRESNRDVSPTFCFSSLFTVTLTLKFHFPYSSREINRKVIP